jgi:hypothetical protein
MRIYYKYKPATGEILAPKPKDFSTNTRPWAKVLSNRMCCSLSFNKLKSRPYLANHYTSISIKCKINNYIQIKYFKIKTKIKITLECSHTECGTRNWDEKYGRNFSL